LSQGFIEPLEATALHMVQATVEGFVEHFEAGEQEAFNVKIAARYEGIRDYIVCHYRVNRRTDTPYWRDNAANQNLSDNLKMMMTSWFRGDELGETIAQLDIGKYYNSLSWHCLFAGYGTFPSDAQITSPGDAILAIDVERIDDFLGRSAMNFRDHQALLQAIKHRTSNS
jgi:tryptophan 6-halogenase